MFTLLTLHIEGHFLPSHFICSLPDPRYKMELGIRQALENFVNTDIILHKFKVSYNHLYGEDLKMRPHLEKIC